jgi:hypothetical protein
MTRIRATIALLALGAVSAAATLLAAPEAGRAQSAPGAETGFAAPQLESEKCEDQTYPECRRLRFAYGPLQVTPGNNAQLAGPVTIEKPAYDGYLLRTNANMVRASDGSVPPVDILHLHHGVWLSVPAYGNFLPFFGVGEEKTVQQTRPGYGMLVRNSDTWLLNYMLHNQITQPETVYIIYDIDYVPREAAERRGIKRVFPLWVDVRYNDRPSYPVFNLQKGYGAVNPRTGRRECSYPRERCAAFDPWGDPQPGNGKGYDWEVPKRFAGTLVGMGGHVHPGGLRDEVSVVRKVDGEERERRIFDSEAVYFDKRGPISWDFSMTVTPKDWRVKVRPGDKIRLNAVYDTEQASWYEGMGIVMAYVAPEDQSGVDPFQKERVRVSSRCRRPSLLRRWRRLSTRQRRRLLPRKRRASARYRRCRRRARQGPRYGYEYVRIPTKGEVTHGHLPENDNYGGERVRSLPGKDGPLVRDIGIRGFQYSPGDLSRVDREGIPRVDADSRLTFRNDDSPASIWHTITTCEPPCTGRTGISYPIADSLPPLDSLELGYGYPQYVQPTAQRSTYSFKPREAGLRPGRTYTYFCRIHPFMRGAFKVVD